jgi:acyl-CoA reductase-like NAD-dependent aldehyde dehydrogenase
VAWAAKFLDAWCTRAMRSRIEPVKKFARTLREQREPLLTISALESSSPVASSRF